MKISIVTATWNSAATVADTLASINAQTHPDIEHIVVDGASTDSTLKIVADHAKRVSRVVSEPDAGLYDAMNKGLKLATGDIVGLLNSDDFLASEDVLAQIASAFEDPRIDAVYGDLCYVRQHEPTRIVRYWRSGPFHPGAFARAWSPPHPTLYVRRSFYEAHGVFDTSYELAADIDLMMRFFEIAEMRSIHIPRVFVMMRLGGATNKSISNIIKQNREIWRSMRSNGLRGSLVRFVLSKAASRARQFITRPSAG